MKEQRNLISEADIEDIAERVNQKLFESFGFDISTPKGRLEAAGAFRHLIFWYRVSGMGFKAAITLAATALAGWILFRLTGLGGPPTQ